MGILLILGWFSINFRAGCKKGIFLLAVKRLIGIWCCFFCHIRGRTGRGIGTLTVLMLLSNHSKLPPPAEASGPFYCER